MISSEVSKEIFYPREAYKSSDRGCKKLYRHTAGLDIQDIGDSHKTLETSRPKCPSYFPDNMQAFLVAMGVVPMTNGLESITGQTRRPGVRNECALWQMNLDVLDT